MTSEHVPSEGLTRGRLLQRAGALGAGGVMLSEPSLAAASERKGKASRATDTLTWALPGSIRSLDFVHGMNIPDLGMRLDLGPGRVTRLELQPKAAGVIDFVCDNFCGDGHEEMHGRFIVSA